MPDAGEIEAFKAANACNNVKFIANPDSPFAADVIGMRKQVLKDGEFADIYTTNLAFERAMFENYKKVRLNNSVDIEAFLIPSIDANHKMQYNNPYDSEETVTYLVQEVSFDFAGYKMRIQAQKFYPYYPFE